MESRDYLRPLLTGLVAIGLVVLVIVLIIKGFSHPPEAPGSATDITNYANSDATVTLLVDGPTSYNDNHYQIKISVSAAQNEIDIIQGYQGVVVNSQTFPNNSAAFAAFLQALNLMNFSKGRQSSEDYRGYCPAGERYIYTFNDGTKNLFSYWSTSCGQGTFQGKVAPVLQQFSNQIPPDAYDKITSGVPVTI
ncbi:MAG TPA: hypothetical protein VMB52_06430 [Verrucomicrobiae bacterium]|nr:hypothetical protein [Verrucomicrobiae bacterium]